MDKTIINFCPTGMVPTKSQTPYVPLDPSEIIEELHEAYDIGITIAHIHARDEQGLPTYKKDVYQSILEGIRKHCPDLVICCSTSGRTFSEFEKRSEVIELRPDMCSLTLSSLNFTRQASVNAPDMITRLAEKMKDFGVKPELECFDLGMINYGKFLVAKQTIDPPYYWNLIFGNIAGFQADLLQMGAAVREVGGEDHFISFGGIGNCQLMVNAIAISSGYGVRLGLEDNIWFDRDRKELASNIALLKRVHQLMATHDRELFTSSAFGNKGFYNATKNLVGV